MLDVACAPRPRSTAGFTAGLIFLSVREFHCFVSRPIVGFEHAAVDLVTKRALDRVVVLSTRPSGPQKFQLRLVDSCSVMNSIDEHRCQGKSELPRWVLVVCNPMLYGSGACLNGDLVEVL